MTFMAVPKPAPQCDRAGSAPGTLYSPAAAWGRRCPGQGRAACPGADGAGMVLPEPSLIQLINCSSPGADSGLALLLPWTHS